MQMILAGRHFLQMVVLEERKQEIVVSADIKYDGQSHLVD